MPGPRLVSLSDLPAANARLAADIARRLNVKAARLPEAVRGARGKLPPGLLAELSRSAASEAWLDHPALRHRIDLAQTRDLHRRTRKALSKVDPKRGRERFWLGLVAGMAVNLALLTAGLVWLLSWRGLV